MFITKDNKDNPTFGQSSIYTVFSLNWQFYKVNVNHFCFSTRVPPLPEASVRHDLQEALREGARQGVPPCGEGELRAEVWECLLVQDLSRPRGPLLLPEQIIQPLLNRIKLTASNLKSKLKREQSKDESHKKSTNLVTRSEARFSQSQSNLQVTLCSRPVSLVSPFFAQLQLLTGETKNCSHMKSPQDILTKDVKVVHLLYCHTAILLQPQ